MDPLVNSYCLPRLGFSASSSATYDTITVRYEHAIYLGVNIVLVVLYLYLIVKSVVHFFTEISRVRGVYNILELGCNTIALVCFSIAASLNGINSILMIDSHSWYAICIPRFFWISLFFLILGCECSLLPIKQSLSLLRGARLHWDDQWRADMIMPIINIICVILGFALSEWYGYTTHIHISLAAVLIYGNTFFSTFTWSFIYICLFDTPLLSDFDMLIVIQLGINCIVMVLSVIPFIMVVKNTSHAETVVQTACMLILIKHVLFYYHRPLKVEDDEQFRYTSNLLGHAKIRLF